MFRQLITSAFESGSDVIVHLRGHGDSFRGSIRDYNSECFTLFHSGCCHGVLWAFRFEDILTCALLIPLAQLDNEVLPDDITNDLPYEPDTGRACDV